MSSRTDQARLVGVTSPEMRVGMGFIIIKSFARVPCQPGQTGWRYQPGNSGWDGTRFIIKILRLCPAPTRPDWSALPAWKCRLGWDYFIILIFSACVLCRPGHTGQCYQPSNMGWDGTHCQDLKCCTGYEYCLQTTHILLPVVMYHNVSLQTTILLVIDYSSLQ